MGKKKSKRKSKSSSKAAASSSSGSAASAAAPAASALDAEQRLPPSLASQFAKMSKYYSRRDFEKGLKVANSILDVRPKHAETLAMKGVLLMSLDASHWTEAEGLMKQALLNNSKSSRCWQLYGDLLQKRRLYQRSLGCFQQALRLGKANGFDGAADPKREEVEKLEGISVNQMLLMRLPEFAETRRKILTAAPTDRNSWSAFISACYVLRNYDMCITAARDHLDGFVQKAERKGETNFPELRRTMAFLVRVYIEAGRPEQAVQLLTASRKKYMTDTIELHTLLTKAYLAVGSFPDAAKRSTRLLLEQFNPPNLFLALYSMGIIDTLPTQPEDTANGIPVNSRTAEAPLTFTMEQTEGLEKLLGTYIARGLFGYRESPPLAELQLIHYPVAHPKYEVALRRYLAFNMKQGVYGAIENLGDAFYANPDKVALLETVALELEENLRTQKRFADAPWPESDPARLFVKRSELRRQKRPDLMGEGPDDEMVNLHDVADNPLSGEPWEDKEQSPSALHWCYVLLAHHFDKTRDYPRALEFANRAVEHTPTSLDARMLRSRIYKHMGSLQLAFKDADLTRSMDTQDRFLNIKCVRAALRAGKFVEALRTFLLFVKPDSDLNLFSLEIEWLMVAVGDWALRERKLSLALRFYSLVFAVFDKILADGRDFHGWAWRQQAIDEHVDLLSSLLYHPKQRYFRNAVLGLLKTYLTLEDALASGDAAAQPHPEPSADAAPEASEEEQQLRDVEEMLKWFSPQDKITPADVFGNERLSKTTAKPGTPLVMAAVLLQKHDQHYVDDVEMQVLAARVYLRQKNLPLALRALCRAFANEPTDADLQTQLAEFATTATPEFWASVPATDPPATVETAADRANLALSELRPRLVDGKASAEAVLTALLEQHADSHAHRVAAVTVATALGDARLAEALERAGDLAAVSGSVTLESARAALVLLEQSGADALRIASYKAAAIVHFPLCPDFMDEAQRAELDAQLEATEQPVERIVKRAEIQS